MHIDSTTLADLEVSGRDGAGGLFDLIDRTTTSRGSAALWRRLHAPPSDLASILATQDTLRFLHDQPDRRRFDEAGIPTRHLLESLEQGGIEDLTPVRPLAAVRDRKLVPSLASVGTNPTRRVGGRFIGHDWRSLLIW